MKNCIFYESLLPEEQNGFILMNLHPLKDSCEHFSEV